MLDIQKELRSLADSNKAKVAQSFFKTGPGQYAEGDIFLGITVPRLRKVAQNYLDLALAELKTLLYSPIHEDRFIALIIFIAQFRQGNEKRQQQFYNFYIKHSVQINNWDLVDLSAAPVVGAYLHDKAKTPLYELVVSSNLWQRRIAIVATLYFIKQQQAKETLKLAKYLLQDSEDLMHKATGWMLREVGKHCSEIMLEKFLQQYAAVMPRTMLRYAVEHFPQQKRKSYLSQRTKRCSLQTHKKRF